MARESGQSRMVRSGASVWRVHARESGIVAGALAGSVSRCRVLVTARKREAAHDCAPGEPLGWRPRRTRASRFAWGVAPRRCWALRVPLGADACRDRHYRTPHAYGETDRQSRRVSDEVCLRGVGNWIMRWRGKTVSHEWFTPVLSWRASARELDIVAGAQACCARSCRLALAAAREHESAHDRAFGEHPCARACG